MSQEPCTLFCPRSGFTPTPSRPMLPVSHREVGDAHDHRGALAVLGDAEPVVDRAVARRWRRAARRRAARRGRRRSTCATCLRGVARIADELEPLVEGRLVAAPRDELLVLQALGHDHVRHRVDEGHVGARAQLQVVRRRGHAATAPGRCGAGRRRSASRPGAGAASCARRTPGGRRWGWRRSP